MISDSDQMLGISDYRLEAIYRGVCTVGMHKLEDRGVSAEI